MTCEPLSITFQDLGAISLTIFFSIGLFVIVASLIRAIFHKDGYRGH
jgi:hypothetical protein